MRLEFRSLFLCLVSFAAACSSSPKGIRRLPDAYTIDAAMAHAASDAADWELAASSWYEIYLRNESDAVVAGVETARALVAQRQIRSAREFLKRALVEHPGQPDLLESYANVLVTSGFRRAAELVYQQALDLDPNRLSAMLSLGRVRLELKLYSASAELLERRIRLGGRDAETWCLLACARRGMERPLDAFVAHQEAFDLGEMVGDRLVFAASAYFELPKDERTRERAEAARAWLRRAITIDSRHASAFEMLGRLEEELGETEQALTSYRAAVAVQPKDELASLRLATLLRKSGDSAAAVRVLEAWLELETDPRLRKPMLKRLEALKADDSPPQSPL